MAQRSTSASRSRQCTAASGGPRTSCSAAVGNPSFISVADCSGCCVGRWCEATLTARHSNLRQLQRRAAPRPGADPVRPALLMRGPGRALGALTVLAMASDSGARPGALRATVIPVSFSTN